MEAGILEVRGPDLVQPGNSKYETSKFVQFDLEVVGKNFHGMERLTMVETYISCGSVDASQDSQIVAERNSVPMTDPNNPNKLIYEKIQFTAEAVLKLCWCGCDILRGCCDEGGKFMIELMTIYVDRDGAEYTKDVMPQVPLIPNHELFLT